MEQILKLYICFVSLSRSTERRFENILGNAADDTKQAARDTKADVKKASRDVQRGIDSL